ncbi:hypothetical protein GBAR_LOCUS12434 [Geodia barretti]|uniref:Transposase domain-containing protein n=1 Tax=Geodia barretti TaxID=519541 RepID=A0AA35S1F1_GEOBA|nr:hypothetical protein GBAR_LOCUS12434 [Geodia barretti]
MIQFNGKFGCPTCKHEGKQVSIGRGSTRAYGYQPVTLRSHSQHTKYAMEAEATSQVVYGVKGKSILHNLPEFDIINNNPVDYMHCVLLGVVRTLISLWFDSKNHKEPWYIGRRISEAESRLLGVKPPDVVTRVPKSFRGRGWKATECRTFLLYYLPLLHGILPDKYLVHALLLSKAMRLLLADEISQADIEIADNLLGLYWRLTEDYYGLKHCKVNVHLLGHLSHYVKLFGPLWTHSAFAFEDAIGGLVKKSHGTHDIANQIVTSFILQWRLHVQRKLTQGPLILKSFVDQLDTKSRSTQRCTQLSQSLAGVGVAKTISLDMEDESILKPLLEKNSVVINAYGTVKLWPKMILQDKVTIYSQASKRVTKRNSYTVTFVDPERPTCVRYGRVQKFVCCPPDTPDSVNAAIVQELKVHRCMELEALCFPSDIRCLSELVCCDFVSVVGELSKLAIPVEHIMAKCFDISTVNMCVITQMVCHSEVLK